jgi:ribonuclease HI
MRYKKRNTGQRSAPTKAPERALKKRLRKKEKEKARRLREKVSKASTEIMVPELGQTRASRIKRKRRHKVRDDGALRADMGIPADAITIYKDGACSENGRVGAKAGYGVFFGDNDTRNISARLPERQQSNQRAELFAVLKALESVHLDAARYHNQPVFILTDSEYTINAVTMWGQSWERNGWKRATGQNVISKDVIKRARELLGLLHDIGVRVYFQHVHSHTGIWGNGQADRLAVQGRQMAAVIESIWGREFDDESLEEELRESLEYADDELDEMIAELKENIT